MAKRKTEEYTFASAYICSSVKNLMSRNDLMRLASCKDLNAAEDILQEFGYGEAKELQEGDIESFIRREQNRHFDLIYDTLPDRKELAFYLLPYDYHNVKVCLKSEFLGMTPNDDYLVSTGDIDRMKIVAMVRDRSYQFMPVNMKNAIIEAVDLFGRGGDPQEIDIIMDKACYKSMLEEAEKTGENFLLDIVKLKIDIINLITFARLRKIDKPWAFFQKIFIEGGNIGIQLFISSYEEPFSQIADKLAPYGFRHIMAEGGQKINETGDFSLFEKLCEDVIMEFNKKAKYLSFGIVPIAGYWHAKEVEIDNLRIVLTGIMTGTSPEEIGERLREPYV